MLWQPKWYAMTSHCLAERHQHTPGLIGGMTSLCRRSCHREQERTLYYRHLGRALAAGARGLRARLSLLQRTLCPVKPEAQGWTSAAPRKVTLQALQLHVQARSCHRPAAAGMSRLAHCDSQLLAHVRWPAINQ